MSHPWDAMHRNALRRGESAYVDPGTGFPVTTEHGHTQRGWCCGSGCRHCPWPEGDGPKAPENPGDDDLPLFRS